MLFIRNAIKKWMPSSMREKSSLTKRLLVSKKSKATLRRNWRSLNNRHQRYPRSLLSIKLPRKMAKMLRARQAKRNLRKSFKLKRRNVNARKLKKKREREKKKRKKRNVRKKKRRRKD